MNKKGALIVGILGILLNGLVALGGVLLIEFVVGEFSLRGVVALEDAKARALCSNVLFNLVGQDYSIRGDLPDSPSSASLLNLYGGGNHKRELGLSAQSLTSFAEHGMYLGLCTGGESEIAYCKAQLKINPILMECNTTIFNPKKTSFGTPAYELFYLRIGSGLVSTCSTKGGACEPSCDTRIEIEIGIEKDYCEYSTNKCCVLQI